MYQLPKLQKRKVKLVRKDENDADFIVPDSREGWVELLDRVIRASFETGQGFSYATHLIRPAGAPIKGFGGTASGAEDLVKGIISINEVLNGRAGKRLRPVDCLDIMNIIGSIVVAGNVRRSAQIALGDHDDIEYLRAKRWDLGSIPNWRAMSNNSVVCDDISLLPEEFWEGYKGNGEPYGLINLESSRRMGRTNETQYPDPDVQGYNPCAEQSLANFETCCLAEIYLPNIESEKELLKVAKYLYRINKHSLAIKCAVQETEDIVHQNMRMGIGLPDTCKQPKSNVSGSPMFTPNSENTTMTIQDYEDFQSQLSSPQLSPVARCLYLLALHRELIPDTRNTSLDELEWLQVATLYRLVGNEAMA